MTAKERSKFIDGAVSRLDDTASITDSQALRIMSDVMRSGDISSLDILASAMQADNASLDDIDRSECISVSDFISRNFRIFKSESEFLEGCAALVGAVGAFFEDRDEDWFERISPLIEAIKERTKNGDFEDEKKKRRRSNGNAIAEFAVWCQIAATELNDLSVFEQSILEEVCSGLLRGNEQSIEIISPETEWSYTFLTVLFSGLNILYSGRGAKCTAIIDYVEKVLRAGGVNI